MPCPLSIVTVTRRDQGMAIGHCQALVFLITWALLLLASSTMERRLAKLQNVQLVSNFTKFVANVISF